MFIYKSIFDYDNKKDTNRTIIFTLRVERKKK